MRPPRMDGWLRREERAKNILAKRERLEQCRMCLRSCGQFSVGRIQGRGDGRGDRRDEANSRAGLQGPTLPGNDSRDKMLSAGA